MTDADMLALTLAAISFVLGCFGLWCMLDEWLHNKRVNRARAELLAEYERLNLRAEDMIYRRKPK